jgi:small subunit ribosomal protein S13
MLRILNKKIQNTKKITYALIKIYGINIFTSNKICKYVGINPKILTIRIKNYHINRLKFFIRKNLVIERFLKKKEINKKKILLKIKNIKGLRQHFGLPIRGQRTHSNAKTSKKIMLNQKRKKYEKKK